MPHEFFEELYGDLSGRFREGPPVDGGHRVILSVFLAKSTRRTTRWPSPSLPCPSCSTRCAPAATSTWSARRCGSCSRQLIELEATEVIGAGRYERTETRIDAPQRQPQPGCCRPRPATSSCTIPKLREGSFFPSLLEPRRRIDRALWAVIMEAYVHGVSTRKVDDLVHALGIDAGVSKSEVSRICAELDDVVAAFRDRRLDHIDFPYVFLDATYVKAHEGARVVSKAIVVATGVAADGDREVLGLAVGDSEDGAFWTAFLRSLRSRGLAGVRLVISDAHEGLQGQSIARC